MSTEALDNVFENGIQVLSSAFLNKHPLDAAKKLEVLPAKESAAILARQSQEARLKVWSLLSPSCAANILQAFDDAVAISILEHLDSPACANLLGHLETETRQHYLDILPKDLADEIEELDHYPSGCAGHLMETRLLALRSSHCVEEARKLLPLYPAHMRKNVYLLDEDLRLVAQVPLEYLVTADDQQRLNELGLPLEAQVNAFDPYSEVIEKLQHAAEDAIPVIDLHHRLLGIIRQQDAVATLKKEFAVGMQTMVGASRDEQALSSSFFAVKKRQAWLQINLLTGFLAAAVVGLFESTIAQFTALAVLMPIAAGQSGNTGAQALAVTMRGLTLREITTRHWLRVMTKEAFAGLINGMAIAITCSIGVYFWSGNAGLALVIALAMIISMTIAGIAGALVPLVLKKLGQDPAQSSSIILTTVTDIAGFMSFLGIATLLAAFLV